MTYLKAKLNSSNFFFFTVSCCLLLLCSCSAKVEEPKKPVFKVAWRQLPPRPVYNRTRWVHLPEVTPVKDLSTNEKAGLILPVIHLEIKEATLKEASNILAATTSYTSYCSSKIASRKISLNTLGTVEELAAQISELAGVNAIVDHGNKEIRFLAKSTLKMDKPRFFKGSQQ